MSELAEGSFTSDWNLPAVLCSCLLRPAASRAEDGCLLVSRSPFDAVLQGHVHSWVRTKYQ